MKKTKKTKIYLYCGEGRGVPGLPHRVSMAQAQTLGMQAALTAAIENGSYRAQSESNGDIAADAPQEANDER